MMESMDEGAMILSEEGIIIYCNRKFGELVKQPSAHVAGTNVLTYIPKSKVQHFQD